GKVSLYLRGGAEWQFDADGRLSAVKNHGLTVRYRWDKGGRLSVIEGWHDDAKKAWVELTYDRNGRLAAAVSSAKQTVRYGYDNAGRLARVQRPGGVAGYRYQGGLVVKVLHDSKTVRQFEYGPDGRLQAERGPDGKAITFAVRALKGGVEVSTK